MNKFLKRAGAVVLTTAMFLSAQVFTVAADEPPQNPLYIPLRAAFESNGAEVLWNSENATITAILGEDTFVFESGSANAYQNGEAFTLNFPISHAGYRTFVSLGDVFHLFAHETGAMPITTMTAVYTAYSLLDLMDITGLTVAIVDAQTGFTWTQGFGFADTQTQTYVNEHTAFHLASISKTFTAMAVMQLVEQGIIDLDTPVVYYLPEFSMAPSSILGGDYRNITVRMLLTHTSGIMANFLAYGGNSINSQIPEYLNNFLARLATYEMTTPENVVFAYNNNGFNLLGVLLATLTSEGDVFNGFVNHMNSSIFAPAGMTRTSFAPDARLMSYMASSYANSTTPDQFMFANGLPTAGVFSTAYDMARFMHIFLNDGGELLSAPYTQQMKQVHDFDFSLALGGMRYGLGVLHSTGMDGFQSFGHGGNWVHFHSEMIFNQEAGLGVFVSTNSISGIAAAPHLANSILATAIFEKTGTIDILPPRAKATATPIELPPPQLERYTGVFAGATEYYYLFIDPQSGILHFAIPFMPELPAFAAIPLSDGSFQTDIGRLWFEIIEEDGEEAAIIRMGDLGLHFIAVQAGQSRELFMATEDFLHQSAGYFAVVNEGNFYSMVTGLYFGVDAFGMAFMQISSLNGVNSASALNLGSDASMIGIDNIQYDTNGIAISFEMLGLRFERVQ
ncbi:MAG: serine hydrolase [Defluviitaleaceae bacterium]|nr:serine hydrolase [Defluviitaleaceae bacterium]